MRVYLSGSLIFLSAVLLASCGALPSGLPRGFAIVYGVAEYSEIGGLRYSDDDGADIYSLLTSGDQGFDPDDVILRLNSAATKAQLEADFATIASRIDALPDPTLTRFVFYFAGHGYGDGMSWEYSFPGPWRDHFADPQYSDEPSGAGMFTDYLLLHGLSISGPADPSEVDAELTAEAESDDDLARHLAMISSRQKTVIIDACHSGGFIGDGTAVDSIPRAYDGDEAGISITDGLTAISMYSGGGADDPADIGPETVVITAAGEQEFSYEYGLSMGIENGVFTHYLLQTPDSADSNYDGLVTVSEAYRFTTGSIASLENPYLEGEYKFMPRLGVSGVDFVLFKAR